MQLSELTVLGTGDLMPALLYGFELRANDTAVELSEALSDGPPDWLISTSVQAGGYSMSYYEVVGAVFRFADNVSLAFQNPAPFIRLFHLMGEDPDFRTLEREFPKLRELCGTWGKDYNATHLDRLGRWIHRFFSLPTPQGGLEAFVRLGPADVDQLFGWTHLHVKNPPKTLEDRAARDALTTDGRFGPCERDVLQRIGARLQSRVPELFLVWENSD